MLLVRSDVLDKAPSVANMWERFQNRQEVGCAARKGIRCFRI